MKKKELDLIFSRNRLEAEMKLHNYTQQSLAAEMGISLATLNRKLQGISDFSRTEIDMIRRILDLSLSEMEAIFFAKSVA